VRPVHILTNKLKGTLTQQDLLPYFLPFLCVFVLDALKTVMMEENLKIDWSKDQYKSGRVVVWT
jgi:hypothetical protein